MLAVLWFGIFYMESSCVSRMPDKLEEENVQAVVSIKEALAKIPRAAVLCVCGMRMCALMCVLCKCSGKVHKVISR